MITTGGTGFTGRDVTPEAVEPLFEKRMDGFATMFLLVSEKKIGTSAIQTRATAGVANATYIFCLPGSPGACKDAWDEILVHQLDYRYRPCNFVEILPRLDEHLRRPKARAQQAEWEIGQRDVREAYKLQIPELGHHVLAPAVARFARGEREASLLVNVPRGREHAVRPERDLLVAGRAREAHALVNQPGAEAEPAPFRIDQQQAEAGDARSESFTSMTQPTFSPFISAIQQRSRFGSYLLTKSATICAHRPSNGSAQPYSCA